MAATLFQMQPWPHEIPEPVRSLLDMEVLQEFIRLIAELWQGSGRQNNFRKAIKFGLRMAASLPNNAERLAGRSIMLLTAFDHYWLRASLGERGCAGFSRRLLLRIDLHKAGIEQFPMVAVQFGLRLARLQSLTDINHAADTYRDTLQAFTKLTDESDWTDMSQDEILLRADIQHELAQTLYRKGECLEAAKYASEAVNCLERSGLSKREYGVLALQGLCLAGSGRDFEALATLKRAREIATSCGDVVSMLSIYRNMSFALAKFGNVKAAANLIDSAYTKFQSLEKVDVKAICLMAHMLATQGGRADLAVNLLEDSFSQYQSSGDFYSAVECALKRIELAIEKGQPATAAKWLRDARRICLPELGSAYRGELYLCIADIAYATGLRPWLALRASQRAGRIFKKHGSLEQQRRCSVTHALACAECEFMEHALYYLDIAFSLPLHLDRAQRATILANAGSVYGRIGRFGESINLLERAIAIQLDCGAWCGAAFALRQLGATYCRLNKLDSAEEYWGKAFGLFRLSGNRREIAHTANNLAACMCSQGRSAEAAKWQTLAVKAISGVQEDAVPVALLTNMGGTFLALGQPKKALQTFERSHTAAVKQAQSPLRRMRPLLGMARANLRLGSKSKALACFKKAIKLIEIYRGYFKLGQHRAGITQLSLEAYIELIALTCELGRSDLALDMIQRVNSRALFEAIASTVASSRASSPKSFDKEEFDPSLAKEHGVRSRDPQCLIRSVQREPVAPKAIIDLLQDRCLIQYFVQGNTAVCCTVSEHSGIQTNVIPIESISQFMKKVDNLIKDFLCRPEVAKTLVNINKALRIFYDVLICPLEGILRPDSAVIIVPSGPLYNIPFGCLFDGQQYLAERFFISYLPHIALLEHSKTGDVAPRSWIGFGDPTGDLSYVQTEFEQIPVMFNQSVVRTGIAATAKNLWSSAQHASVLHIATRVKRDLDNPYNTSFQVFGKNSTVWTPFADVLKTKLNAALAVLRCCYTGEARPWLGGEVAAVWTSFLLAGCKAVLASPWQVYESQDVSQLIIRFYELWVKGGKPLVQALTLAQREAISQGLFPAMWGFPLLIGNT